MENKESLPQKISKDLSFELVKGSNYKMTDSFQREYIVGFDEFLRISRAVFKEGTEFVTVGKRILGARYIYMIEPTKEKTDDEKAVIAAQKREQEKQEEEERRIGQLKRNFELNFFNAKYGTGKWTGFTDIFKVGRYVITTQDRLEAITAFKKQYPDIFSEESGDKR